MSVRDSGAYLANKEQQVSVASEIHGEEEEGQLLHHRDAALMGQCEGQLLHFWGFFGHCGLCVQRGAGPLSCPPQTDQVFKVLKDRNSGNVCIRVEICKFHYHCIYQFIHQMLCYRGC